LGFLSFSTPSVTFILIKVEPKVQESENRIFKMNSDATQCLENAMLKMKRVDDYLNEA